MNATEKSDVWVIQALRKKGYKATPQRIAICRFALHSRDHPTAQRIYNEVKEVHPTVSIATVYKTIQVLRELGRIQELNFLQGQTRFDSYMQPHINLVCLRCGNIRDLEDPTAREMVARAVAATKFTASGQSFDIFGICQRCARATS
jgi:Fur family peroxide stress response transcriptional regulator